MSTRDDDSQDGIPPPPAAQVRATRSTQEISEDELASFEDRKTSPEVRARPLRAESTRPVGVVASLDARRRHAISEALCADGWHGVEVTGVEELLELTRTLAPQVVFADAEMRRGDQPIPHVLRQQRQDATLRTVALIRHELAEESFARTLADGFDDFVPMNAPDAKIVARAQVNLRVARTLADMTKQRRDAALLLELTQTLASSLDMGLILHRVSRLISEVVGLERCSIILLDTNNDDAIMVAASDDRSVRDLPIQLSEYPELKLCVESAAPVLIDDVAAAPVLERVAKSLLDRGVRKQALFPIVHEEDVIGVLFLRSSNAALNMGQHEIQFAQTVASACATAIRNARLFDSFRDRSQHMETMRMQAERQSEALKKYQDFFEYAADGIAVIDVDGVIHYVNKEGRRLLGRAWEDLRSVRFPALLLDDSARLWPELVAQVRHGRFRRSFDVVLDVASQERVLSLSAGGVGQGTGLLILSFRDVTELRAMEGELRTTKEFLESLIDNSVDAIVAADKNGDIILFNKGAEQVFGYRREEVVGVMPVRSLYPQGGVEEVMTRLRDPRWGGLGRLAAERREIKVATGGVVPVSMSASIIYEDGEEVATVSVFTDLRDRVAIEQQLSEARDQLMKAERARVAAELAGMAAHELNQPLTSVLGYAEMLRARIPEQDARIRRPVETIFQQAERMAEIVRKIGSITKYETKRYGANTDMIDLNRAAADLSAGVLMESASLPASTSALVSGSLPVSIPASPSASTAGSLVASRPTPSSERASPGAQATRNVAPSELDPWPGIRADSKQIRGLAFAETLSSLSPVPAPEPGRASPPGVGAPLSVPSPDGGPRLATYVPPGHDVRRADARAAIVRPDTVDVEPAGYVRRLQRAQSESSGPTAPAAGAPPGKASPGTERETSQPTAVVRGPNLRSLAFDETVPANVEGDMDTNPGVRVSDLRRRVKDEPPR